MAIHATCRRRYDSPRTGGVNLHWIRSFLPLIAELLHGSGLRLHSFSSARRAASFGA
jgi:hypothetical protein